MIGACGGKKIPTVLDLGVFLIKFLPWVFLIPFLIFHFNNLMIYKPEWGFDGNGHLGLIRYFAKYHSIPDVRFYGVSNPPLYYVIGAYIYGLFGLNSAKLVQLFSFLLYIGNLYFLSRTLSLFSKDRLFRYALVAFFAFLPVHLNYAYMTLNYSLSHFIEFATFYLILKYLYEGRDRGFLFHALGLGLLTAAGLMTSLTHAAFFCSERRISSFFQDCF